MSLAGDFAAGGQTGVHGTIPIWLNGRLLAGADDRLSVLDRGFTLGDGVFETMRASGPRLLWLADHLARLRAGAAVLGIDVPLDDTAIAEGLAGLLAAAAEESAALRLTLSRGPAARGLWPGGAAPTPTLLATIARLPPVPGPVDLIVARTTRRNAQSPLSRIKSLNYGDNLLARREAALRGAGDALMLNGMDRVACATAGNLFLRIRGRWQTPLVAEGAMPGLARQRLLHLLGGSEAIIASAGLDEADAGMISNSLGLVPVRSIDGRGLADVTVIAGTIKLYDPG